MGSSAALLLVCGMLGRGETGGTGRRGDRGGDVGALGFCGAAARQKLGLMGGETAR